MSRRPCRVISQAFLRTKTNGLRRHKDGAKVACHRVGRVDGQNDDVMVWEIYLFAPFMLEASGIFTLYGKTQCAFPCKTYFKIVWKILRCPSIPSTAVKLDLHTTFDASIGASESRRVTAWGVSNKAEKEIRVHNGSRLRHHDTWDRRKTIMRGPLAHSLNGAAGWFYWFYKLCTIYLRKICEQSVRHLWANVIENNNTSPPCLALDVMNTLRARALCMEVYLVPRAR